MQSVEVKVSRKQRASDKIYGTGDKSIQASEVSGSSNFFNALQFLQGTVAGVQVTGFGADMSVSIRGSGTPLILVNDIPVSLESINMIPAQSIESVDVFKSSDAAIFGIRGGNGVIAFYTKSGGNSYSPPSSEGYFPLRNFGYHVPKEFYSPKYDVAKPEHVKPDERIVLYWNPIIKTNEQGKAVIEFYNHDFESSVHGIVQGLTNDGVPLYSKIEFQIVK